MPEEDPSLRRVNIGIPPRHAGDLIDLVGRFAAVRGIDIEIGEPGTTEEPSSPTYDSDLITSTTDVSGEEVHILTHQSLSGFAGDDWSVRTPTDLINSLWRYDRTLIVHDRKTGNYGVDVTRFKEIMERLEGRAGIPGIGKKNESLLQAVYGEIFPEQ